LKQLLLGFSLIPTQGRLSLRLMGKPHTPHVANVIKYGGVGSIAAQRRKAEDMVLLWMDTAQISHEDLVQALKHDGKSRNLLWKLAGTENDIVKLSKDQLIQAGEGSLEGGEPGVVPKRSLYRAPSRYSITFKDRYEARRFVREWHRRPFPLQKGHKPNGEEPPIMNVEILW